ncbi:Glycylpeptide N-tetradecanoyltransferase [Plasmodiophora brassicae]|uniref:Glycylpeptide N-tetradecanoyltransferase n=1 Tax=Plasmodiophora brassicae TaxID=37360 RepID=A0A0G4IZ77_PLABS|nr:hypothetical protein PBRA_001415 [Plasmodiophora brassicae]SPQ94131.1 unnamed protein product [Plasmodiophora brassicae]
MHDRQENGDGEECQPHAFWDTQPVPRLNEVITDDGAHGPIDKPRVVADVRPTPYALPEPYEWYDLDMTNPEEVDQLYDLLTKNYVEDSDAMFRFDYSREFLCWALMPPGFRRDWHPAVRIKSSKKLVAFISAIPAKVQAYNSAIPMVEINYLCVHKKLRNKRLAPVLIKEITRRVNLTNVWQAAYTAGALLPKPVARNRYYHRTLNAKKLVDVGFTQLGRRMTMKMMQRLCHLEDETSIPGLRQMTPEDVPGAHALLSKYLSSFKLFARFEPEEFAHWFSPRDKIVYAFVVEDPKTHEITDMISFYSLPSSVLGHPVHQTLYAAFSFYNVAGSVEWPVLMRNALILAKRHGFDVFNVLNIMDNDKFLDPLRFGRGDGNLHYYLYNWKCPEVASPGVALVLM